MYWHIDTDIVSLVIIVAIWVCNRKIPPKEPLAPRNIRFSRCLEVGIGITVTDIAASIIMEVPTTRFIYHLFMTVYFACIELVFVEWILYVLTIIYEENEKGRRAVAHSVLTIYALYFLLSVSNPWTGLVYTLGPNNEYSRGPFFTAMLIIYALYTLMLFVLILARWKHIPKNYSGTVIVLTPIIIAVGIALQLSISGWLMIVPSYMVCLALAYLFLQTQRVRSNEETIETLSKVAETDSLTGLLNRAGLDEMVEDTLNTSSGEGVLVILIDIDNLKQINDTFGHVEGDQAIKEIAKHIKRHFRDEDTVTRYGGDEYLVFVVGALSTDRMNEMLQTLIDDFATIFIGENKDIPVSGSIGAAYGYVGKDSFASLCDKADAALYHVKRNGKRGYTLYDAATMDVSEPTAE